MRRDLLSAATLLALALPQAASAQRETFGDTGAVFEFSRQAVVFTDLTLFRETHAVAYLDLKEEIASTWLPWDLVSVGRGPEGEPWFRLKYSFLLLHPLDYQGPIFGDRLAAMGHVVEGGGVYKTMVDVGDWYPGGVELEVGGGGEVLFTRLASTQTPDLQQEISFTENTSPFIYGTEWVGSAYLYARFGPFLRWQSKLRFNKRNAVNPGQISLDGKGALAFPERDNQGGVELSLFDQFEIAGVGLAGEVQHGEDAWNFKQMLMAGIREKILVPQINTSFELGFKGFDGFSTNLMEFNVAYYDLPEFGWLANAGGRLGFDGKPYSARLGLTYMQFRGELTMQFTNRFGEPDRALGFGLGVSGVLRFFMDTKGKPPPTDMELAVYYNYLDHLDQMPGLRGTLFVTGRFLVQAY